MPTNTAEPHLKLSFNYGGWENSHQIEWRDGILTIRNFFTPNPISGINASPSEAEWQQFWHAVDLAKVWEWNSAYNNDLVLDGVQWSLKLEHDGRKISCRGSNSFPGYGGPEFPDTCDFAKFLDAIEVLARFKF